MIRYDHEDDLEILKKHDKHISETELKKSINDNRILIMLDGSRFIGWLRFNLFWDSIPFMNMLFFWRDKE